MEPEAFLRLCLRARRDPSARAALPASFDGLDWPAVVDLANGERLTPLLYHTLKDQPVPPKVLGRLRTVFYESARTNILRFQQLKRILNAFSSAGIPVILLKGAALADKVYGSIALRPMTDLDMLVPRHRLKEAVSAALTLGYLNVQGNEEPDMLLIEACVVQLSLPEDPGSLLEIHWDVLHPPYFQDRVDQDWLWQSAQPITIENQPALLLSPEAQILHLCAHLCLHHHAEGILWQNDVAEVLSSLPAPLDWDLLIEKAAQYQLTSALQIVLPQSASDLAAPVPEEILARLVTLTPGEREKQTFSRLMAANQSAAQLTYNFMKDLPGWRLKLRYTLNRLFPAPAYMLQHYRIPHPLLTPFYYPYRWIIGLKRR